MAILVRIVVSFVENKTYFYFISLSYLGRLVKDQASASYKSGSPPTKASENGATFFKGIYNDSKYTNGAPWTLNQKTEMINIFGRTSPPPPAFITFEVRTNSDILKRQGAQSSFTQGQIIRIYRDDVYKTISNGSGLFQETIKMSTTPW